MSPIANMKTYVDGMRKSLLDKIWFLDKVDSEINSVYDYGCADGALLQMIGEICPGMDLAGYDICQEMIDLAKQAVPGASYLSTSPRQDLCGTVLNASSVFHEIHAYSPNVADDYHNIFGSGASYIAIRAELQIAGTRTKQEYLLSHRKSYNELHIDLLQSKWREARLPKAEIHSRYDQNRKLQ